MQSSGYIVLYVIIIASIMLFGALWGFSILKNIVKKSIRDNILGEFQKIEAIIRDEFLKNRQESQQNFKDNRTELSESLKSFEMQFAQNVKEFNELQRQKFGDLTNNQEKLRKETEEKLEKIREAVEKKLQAIQVDNTRQLEEMRKTVDEKLQKTLNDRLSQSFELVSKQLESVNKGLGDMQNIANSVGDLKKVMSNVKSRGVIGEYQLQNLLEDLLISGQYERNVKTKIGSGAMVEFAIKMPHGDNFEKTLWMPIDSKFPREDYDSLVDAYEKGDLEKIEEFRKAFVKGIKKNAQDIKDKYIDPPNTTDFGIMFLPYESLFGEVLRVPGLFEQLQKDYNITITGPTTLAAILNSLQMGFRTLRIQKKSSEVWEVLKAVKTEFEIFEKVLKSAQQKILGANEEIEKMVGVRTRQIQRKLRDVETLAPEEAKNLLESGNEEELTIQ